MKIWAFLLTGIMLILLLPAGSGQTATRRAASPRPKATAKPRLRTAVPVAAQISGTLTTMASLDAVVEAAIREDKIPGAVLLAGQPGRTLHFKAYGWRSVLPTREPMTTDTVFDIASLTKVVATTSAIMKLFDEGKVRLNDPVTTYLPEFQGGASDITVRQLLTHFSGLRPDVDLKPVWAGYDTGIKLALADKPVAEPGARFIYSDINFILLGEIVKRVSGKPLPQFVRTEVFEPLGMKDTFFQPSTTLGARIAPTEVIEGQPLRGLVHDPTTRYMGGVAGHAGLFSTASDLAMFAEMMLGRGQRQGVKIVQPQTVTKFTTPQTPPDQPVLRGLGWDIDSPFSGNRGELFPVGSYGHTGFTGTSLWIDPVTQTYVILLTNAVHRHSRPAITPLRSKVATLVASGIGINTPGVNITGYNDTLWGAGVRRTVARNGNVLTGIDVLRESNFAELRGKRVGLITNHTGLSRDGRRNVDVMMEAGITVAGLFSPEHGIAGNQDHENLGNSVDSATGVRIWSLYSGENRRPSPEMLGGLDALVFDIQDIGARFYTYSCTMAYAMEEAAKARLPFYVLDRPNPITGVRVEGPMLDADKKSFIGCYELPLRHGMTLGEIATMINAEQKLGLTLHVVRMKGWQRGDWFDSTGLTWIDPSPSMRGLPAAALYPGVAMLEYSKNYSVGRGTAIPFEQVGADWIKGRDLASYLNARQIPGVRFYPTVFRPEASNFQGALIEGVRLVIIDREILDSSRLGIEIASALGTLYPGRIAFDANARLIGNGATIAALSGGQEPRAIVQRQEEELTPFLELRKKYLLY